MHYHKTGYEALAVLDRAFSATGLVSTAYEADHHRLWNCAQVQERLGQAASESGRADGGFAISEAPELSECLLSGPLRVAHFVREPYSAALSFYRYHKQVPMPEDWLTWVLDPCMTNTSQLDVFERALDLTRLDTAAVTDLCERLASKARELVEANPRAAAQQHEGQQEQEINFVEMLNALPPIDGVQLAAAFFLLHDFNESPQKRNFAGGDLLREAANTVALRANPALTVRTFINNEFASDAYQPTVDLVDFLFPGTPHSVAAKVFALYNESEAQERADEAQINFTHVTSSTVTAAETAEQEGYLRNSRPLAKLLDRAASIICSEIACAKSSHKASVAAPQATPVALEVPAARAAPLNATVNPALNMQYFASRARDGVVVYTVADSKFRGVLDEWRNRLAAAGYGRDHVSIVCVDRALQAELQAEGDDCALYELPTISFDTVAPVRFVVASQLAAQGACCTSSAYDASRWRGARPP